MSHRIRKNQNRREPDCSEKMDRENSVTKLLLQAGHKQLPSLFHKNRVKEWRKVSTLDFGFSEFEIKSGCFLPVKYAEGQWANLGVSTQKNGAFLGIKVRSDTVCVRMKFFFWTFCNLEKLIFLFFCRPEASLCGTGQKREKFRVFFSIWKKVKKRTSSSLN